MTTTEERPAELVETVEATEEWGVLRVLDRNGDTPLRWDPANRDEVDDARQRFAHFKGRGYLAYKRDEAGERETISEFDPAVREVVMVPQPVGG
jgi:hypothetical protein